MDSNFEPMDLSLGPMDLSLVCSAAWRVPNAMTPSSLTRSADTMLISTDNEIAFSLETTSFPTVRLPLSPTENEDNLSNVTTGSLLATTGSLLARPYSSPYNFQDVLHATEASADFTVDEFLFPNMDSTETSTTVQTQQENGRDNSANNRNMMSRIVNLPQERRDQNVRTITEIVLSEESRNNRYSGYSMLVQFAKDVENSIYSAVNGEGEYSHYFTQTVDVVRRTFEEWKHDNPDKEFSVGRDLFGMNMQDILNRANPKCASVISNSITTPVLSNPITTPVLSNPITIPVLSNPITTPVLSNPITTPVVLNPITTPVLSNPITITVLSNPITTLSSEATSTVNQPSVSTANSSNESPRNNNRFEPYPSTSWTFSRTPRRYRSRQYIRTYSVCFYRKSHLPFRVNHSWTHVILETVIEILVDDGEDDIRGKLVDLLLVKHGYHHITEDDLVFLKSARRQLDLPVSPPEFQWNGDKIRRLIGSGKFHVMVQIEMMIDSSFSTSCLIDVCERNDPRRRQLSESASSSIPRSNLDRHMATGNDSVEFMDEEEAVNEAIRRSLADRSQSHGPNTSVSPEESNDKIARALREHADRVVKGFKRYITIKREDLWNSALEFFKKPDFFKESGTLSVKFQIQDGITEEASDFSGPKREFFRLLIREICHKSGALVETPNGLVPRNNIRQLQEGVLRHVGRMISTIVMQGGEAPAIFSPIITQCILKDPISTKPDVDDIPDLVVRESLKLVQQANDQESLEKALNSCEWRFDVDGLPLFIKMENKEDFIQSSAMYFAILQRQTGIQQLLQGLEYYDLLELMRRKPFISSILEYKKDDVFAKDLIVMMKPEYSYTASRKEREEKLFSNLKEFLQLIEDRTLLHRLDNDIADLTVEERDFISAMKPSKLLEFCTGSSKVPALGFKEDPHVTFTHNDEKFHPSAHTCGNKLVMYVNDKTVNDKSSFFKIMVETLMNAEHFGFG